METLFPTPFELVATPLSATAKSRLPSTSRSAEATYTGVTPVAYVTPF